MSEPLPGVVHFTFDAPPGETPPPGWRHDLLPVLKSFGDEGAAEDVVLAAGELIANAVEHGGGLCALHVEGGPGHVMIEVYDHVPALGSPPSVARDRGRGLAMVEALARDWGWIPCCDGKLVWARFTCGEAMPHAS
jgi:hypothetical protein